MSGPQFGTLPTEAEVVEAQVADAVDTQKAQELTLGRECWDPSTGRLPTDIVVKWTDSGQFEVIPFTDQAGDQAVAGQFETLLACA